METIARNLRLGHQGAPALPGQTITGVTLHWPRHIAEPTPRTFRRRIHLQTIQSVLRRGKYLVLPLSRGCLLIHLKMSGDLEVARGGSPPGSLRTAHSSAFAIASSFPPEVMHTTGQAAPRACRYALSVSSVFPE